MAGSSYMYIRMTLVDAETQKVVRDEDFNSTNNVFAAAWTFGSTDRSLPSDMAEIMADYIDKAVPANLGDLTSISIIYPISTCSLDA